jgi:hypothetical protein
LIGIDFKDLFLLVAAQISLLVRMECKYNSEST